jgi:hypothetical protein
LSWNLCINHSSSELIILGLIPHDDGPLYEPVVAVISLGSAILNYWEMSSNGKGD